MQPTIREAGRTAVKKITKRPISPSFGHCLLLSFVPTIDLFNCPFFSLLAVLVARVCMMVDGHIVNNTVSENDPSALRASTAQINCLTP